MKSVIIGTAGHIDHGKTALVKALTGVDTDRLPEEKARGITIDIGFAHMNLEEAQVSFVDVPGHERFIRNMLAGIGGIDLLMLVVAADESVMPQTREHFDICRLLNIPSGVVVITKNDLVDPEVLVLVRQEIAGLVKGSFLENAPVFAVSSKNGEGIDALKRGLADLIRDRLPRRPDGLFRMPIDRVFVLKGRGTVVTGTVLSGIIRRESFAEILPAHRTTRIRSIHAHDKPVEEALAGQRTALNLQGLDREQIQRGDVLTVPDVFESASLLDVHITLLPNAKPLAHNAIVRFHHQTTDSLARITLPEGEILDPGGSGFAQLRLQKHVFALHGDRFILRKHSPLVTVGGGIILDHMPAGRLKRNDREAVQRLKALATAGPATRLSMAVHQRGNSGADQRFLKAKLAMEGAEIALLSSPDVVFLRRDPLLCVAATTLEFITAEMLKRVAEFHQKNPLMPGIAREELRSKFFPHVSPDLFTATLERAAEGKRLQAQKETISVFGRNVLLSREEEDLTARVEQGLIDHRLEFPGIEARARELELDPGRIRTILYLLVRQGKVIKVGDDYFLHITVWEELKRQVRTLKGTQKSFSVPDFKALFGVSRKYAIPLLERLDQDGVTRRSGNERIIV
jgi:selenocysteine-specific elongation factor